MGPSAQKVGSIAIQHGNADSLAQERPAQVHSFTKQVLLNVTLLLIYIVLALSSVLVAATFCQI